MYEIRNVLDFFLNAKAYNKITKLKHKKKKRKLKKRS